ncbi:hypothetical protein MAR_011321 [Mya arenaria]|uniref:Uncharacterized protein n=1 Tax=Mya arenaria TaxID=6604 RepID=A0ABY7FX63_MYAAR|nr:hypothetical protein MAR_011321 [Mya arenaria]
MYGEDFEISQKCFVTGNAIAHVERVTTESCRAKRCANTPVETLQTLSSSPSAAESITLSVEKLSDSHMQELDSQLSCFSGMKSFLFKKDSLSEDTFFLDAVLEMCKGCPLLAQCIFTALGKKISEEAMIATATTIYGMILHCRNKKVSGLQRLLTTVCLRYNADNKFLTHLNKVHLTLSEESKRKQIQDFGDKSENSIISAIAEGHDDKLNGDNLDIRVNTNDMRMDVTSRNKDYHFFATDFTLDRVNLDHLSKVTPNVEAVQARCFLPNDEEQQYYKKRLKILLGRGLQKLDGFKWMTSLIPAQIPHPLDEKSLTVSFFQCL